MEFNIQHFTGNLRIRLIEESDALSFYKLIESNRSRLEDFFAGTVAATKSLEDTSTFIKENIEKHSKGTYHPFVIIDEDESIIGYIDIKNIDMKIPKAEIGYFIDHNFVSKGIITNAVKNISDYFFEKMKFEKLFLRAHSENTASRKVAEKCGFKVEGVLRSDYKTTKGELTDMVYYGKLKNE